MPIATAIKIDPWKAIDFAIDALENEEAEVSGFLKACQVSDVEALEDNWPDFFEEAVTVQTIKI